jgi:hypothetical protein
MASRAGAWAWFEFGIAVLLCRSSNDVQDKPGSVCRRRFEAARRDGAAAGVAGRETFSHFVNWRCHGSGLICSCLRRDTGCKKTLCRSELALSAYVNPGIMQHAVALQEVAASVGSYLLQEVAGMLQCIWMIFFFQHFAAVY